MVDEKIARYFSCRYKYVLDTRGTMSIENVRMSRHRHAIDEKYVEGIHLFQPFYTLSRV